jgi:twinkle protein
VKNRYPERESSPHLYHEPCPKCGSKDNLSRRADGGAWCFGCGHHEKGDGEPKEAKRLSDKPKEFKTGVYADLTDRGLTRETLEKWGYQINVDEKCHIANYRDASGELVAQKMRRAGKKFQCINGSKDMPLYGMWRAQGDLSVVIVEGEIDALSVSQAFKHKYAVVSLPNGAKDAAYNCQRYYEWLDGFKKIVLMFDQDEQGRQATEEAAAVLPFGKVAVAVLPHKDANEVLVKDGAAAIVSAFWGAKTWRPDGIVSGDDISIDDLMEEMAPGYPIDGCPELEEKLMGWRKGELTLLTAGSGIGKSTWARQIAYNLRRSHGLKIGNVFLEEQYKKTAKAYVALHHSVPLARLRANSKLLTREQYEEARSELISGGKMSFYNHFGSLEQANLVAKLRYMATVEKCDFIFLDHISIITSGMESSSEGERKDIDILMTRLASLVQETGVGIIAIVHLKRAKDKSFNEGDQISLNDLRGSAALEQLSFNVVALERDQQAEDDAKDQSVVRVLKCRETGDTGVADTLVYNRSTGWLTTPVVAAL